MHDVIVAGAGPAGNMAALRLAEAGRDVLVLDWRHNIGDKLCTGIIGRECFERFQPDPQTVFHEARSARVFSPSGASYRFQRDRPEAYVIDRVAFVASLSRRAEDSGASYVLGEKVVGISANGRGVAVETVGPQGSATYSARALVIASGFGTPLLKMVGLGDGASLQYMIGCQAKVSARGLVETEVYLGSALAPGSFAWLVPLRGSTALAGMVSQERGGGHMDRFLEMLREGGRIDSVADQPRRWGIPIEPLPKTFGDRVVVAGDAAGLAKPTTGGGIYYSLLSGEIAAEVMNDAMAADDLSAETLAAYESRWKGVFGAELDVGYLARKAFEYLDDGQIDTLLDTLVSRGVHRDVVSSNEFAFDWHSRMILKALRHRRMNGLLRTFGQGVTPLLTRLAKSAE
jgi:digeranylgeranylglycerophospholipid reductase